MYISVAVVTITLLFWLVCSFFTVYILSKRRTFGAGAEMWLQGGFMSQTILLDITQEHSASGLKNSWPRSAFCVLHVGVHGIPELEEWSEGEILQCLQPSWELLPVTWLLFHVLQAWSCARSWTVNRVKLRTVPSSSLQ